jgi:chemotaxis protein MotB
MKILKKKKPTALGAHNTAEDDGDAWLLTYADMVTLLLCFFAVLIGMSKIDMLKVEQMTQHFSAKKQGMTMQELSGVIAEVIKQEQLEDKISVQVTSRGIEINFKDKLLFDLGQAELKHESLEVLSKMSKLINHKDVADKLVYVEGHTDSIPIRSSRFPSNWELSSARAASVVRFFIGEGISSRKFVSIGHADTWPVAVEKDASTGSPENRRVVAVITPETFQE